MGSLVESTDRLAIREILRGISLHLGFEREKRKREKRKEKIRMLWAFVMLWCITS